jgi:branched-subunit amino acid transport protein
MIRFIKKHPFAIAAVALFLLAIFGKALHQLILAGMMAIFQLIISFADDGKE